MKKLLSTICSVMLVWGILVIYYEDVTSMKPKNVEIIEVDEKNFMFSEYGVMVFKHGHKEKDQEHFKLFIPHRVIHKITKK